MPMPAPSHNGPPSTEELQKNLADFMRQQFQNMRSMPFTKAAASGAAGEGSGSSPAPAFQFDKTPKEVKAYLDRFVIKQEEAK